MLACHSGRASRSARRINAATMPTISALELLMPDARGRSLANTTSAPRDREAFRQPADERPPACIVRVLAEDLESAGNPPDVIRGGTRRLVEAGEDALEQRRLWRMLGRIETACDERRRERPPRHGCGTMCDRRAATSV